MKTALLAVAMLLGLAWAVRGHFGHEWGAAWAGAIGGLAVVVVSGRDTWLRQLPRLAALSAIGWGVGGMMSYGIVIGYCRGDDPANVLYGYTMLAVIGALYGAIGGGFLGLGLESSEDRRPQWSSLITEMVAGGLLFWGLLIYQLEWYMTPPRSELWAACLGATAALLWYCRRNGFEQAYRISLLTALGAGFGFAFGNFLQGLGIASGINYNWWNVMEFNLGFFGGLAMAYGVATSSWQDEERVRIDTPSNAINMSLFFILLFVPFTNLVTSFTSSKISRIAEALGVEQAAEFTMSMQIIGVLLVVVFALIGFIMWKRGQPDIKKTGLLFLTFVTLHYVLLGMVLKGFFMEMPRIGNSVTLYLPLLVLGIWLTIKSTELSHKKIELSRKSLFILLIICLLVMTFISLATNPELTTVNRRF